MVTNDSPVLLSVQILHFPAPKHNYSMSSTPIPLVGNLFALLRWSVHRYRPRNRKLQPARSTRPRKTMQNHQLRAFPSIIRQTYCRIHSDEYNSDKSQKSVLCNLGNHQHLPFQVQTYRKGKCLVSCLRNTARNIHKDLLTMF